MQVNLDVRDVGKFSYCIADSLLEYERGAYHEEGNGWKRGEDVLTRAWLVRLIRGYFRYNFKYVFLKLLVRNCSI